MQNPLAGIGVVELGAGSAIAYAGKLFADLGAEVTRIEITGDGSASGGTTEDGAANPLALFLNARKAELALDLSRAVERVTLRGLLARSRVLLHAGSDRRFAEQDCSSEGICAARIDYKLW